MLMFCLFRNTLFIYTKLLVFSFVFTFLLISFACSDEILEGLTNPESIETSLSEDRIYLNRGYDFQKRKFVSLGNQLTPAAFYFYQSQPGEVGLNTVGIGDPNRFSIYKLADTGNDINRIAFVDDFSSGSYQNVVNPVEIGFYAVFDLQNTYTILYVKEYVIDDRDSYILIEWKRQINGTSSFE